MSLAKKIKKQREILNTMCYNHYLYQLSSIAMCQFDYDGLPDSITKEHVERILFFEGAGVFYFDDVLNEFHFLSVNPEGKYDLNNEPIFRVGYGQNGFRVQLNEKNSVIVYNNILKAPTYPSAQFYAERIADLQRSFDVNTKSLKNPKVFQGQKKQLETFKNMYEQYDGNSPVLYISEDLDIDSIFKSFNAETTNNLPQLAQAKRELWCEYLNTLGIASTTIQKKERLVSDEISQSVGGAIANFSTRYKVRKNCIDQINKMFGLNISVLDKENERDEIEMDGDDIE